MPTTILYGTCGELSAGRSGVFFDRNRERTYTRRFLVQLAQKDAATVAACQHPDLPLPWSSYVSSLDAEYDLLSLLVRMKAEQEGDEGSWYNWIVTCEYSTQMPEGGPQSTKNDNPEQDAPEVDWEPYEHQWCPRKDLLGKAFVNSSGQPYTPAYSEDIGHQVLVYSRNEMGFNRNKAKICAFATNSKPFLGAPRDRAQCLPVRAKMMFRGPLTYWRVTYRIRFWNDLIGDAEDDWQPRVLDAGMMEKKFVPLQGKNVQKLMPIILDNGLCAHQPVLLDGNGKRQQAVDANGQLIPKFNKYKTRHSMDLNVLLSRGLS